MNTHVYLDTDRLGRGEYFAYVSFEGHILVNLGGYATANDAKLAADQWIAERVETRA